MSQLWLPGLAILIGFAGLVWSADRFVGGSAAIARNLGISRLIIGLTIVSLGTSAPEIVVSISASLKQAGELAIGNALGSNLANIGLVLAITALLAPLPIQKHLLKQEIPILLAVTTAAGFVLYDAKLVAWEGALLLLSIIPLIYFMIVIKRRHPSPEEEDAEIPEMSNNAAVFWFILGLLLLVGSSELLVWGAKNVATAFGVSPLIIGLTVIAVGTSLPELAASVVSALKGHHDMALGNIIGSNIFNILTVMALPGLFHTVTLDSAVFSRDYLAMSGITLLLVLAILFDWARPKRDHNGPRTVQLGAVAGITLLLVYVCYYIVLFR